MYFKRSILMHVPFIFSKAGVVGTTPTTLVTKPLYVIIEPGKFKIPPRPQNITSLPIWNLLASLAPVIAYKTEKVIANVLYQSLKNICTACELDYCNLFERKKYSKMCTEYYGCKKFLNMTVSSEQNQGMPLP